MDEDQPPTFNNQYPRNFFLLVNASNAVSGGDVSLALELSESGGDVSLAVNFLNLAKLFMF